MGNSIDRDDIVDAITAATTEVFTTMLGMEVDRGDIRVETIPPPPCDGVVSFIGVAGSWVGTGTIQCSADFACKICAALLMMEAPSVNDEVLDAVGEITNMVIGNFKTTIEETLGPLGLSIPTVIFGRNFTARSLGRGEWTVVPFRSGDDEFEIRICLARSTEPALGRTAGAHSLAL